MKIKLLKFFDLFIGLPAVRLFPSPKKKPNRVISKILIIRPGGIGDAVLLIPLIQSIKKTFPKATLSFLAETRNAAVFQLCPEIDAVLHYDRPTELITALRSSYDLVIDTEQWHRLSAVVARLTRATVSIGFATNERQRLFSKPVPYSQDEFEVYSFLKLFGPYGEDSFNPNRSFIEIPERYTASVRPLLNRLGRGKLVAIFPGSSIDERKWGINRFHETAKLLAGQGYHLAVIGGKDDVSAGRDIISDIPESLNLCGKLSLPETAAVLKESTLLITGDSGIMHIGYGLGIKVLALFGPGREQKWAPRGKNCKVINKHLPCSPCTTFGYTPKCKRNAECMKRITVEEVFEASMTMLK
jgi:ADP-heptose:LPS heptosyltransferase